MENSDVTPPEIGAGKSAPPPPIPAPPVPRLGVGGSAPVPPPVPSAKQPAVPPPTQQPPAPAPTQHPSVPAPAKHPSVPDPTHATLASTRSHVRRTSSITAAKSGKPSPDSRTPLPDGTRVGDYTITSKIGVGGFGIVYAAIHTKDGTPVAIKEHMPEGLAAREPNGTYVIHSSPETEARFKATVGEFLEEVTVLMGISHPGIVPILTAFQENGTAYYVMPFQKGKPLAVPEQTTLDFALQSQEARHIKRLLLSMLSIMDYLRMHQIVHRDIKPDNIMVTEEGNPVLLDFGSARQVQPGKVFTNVFTPDFSAPEQSHAETDAEMSASLGPWTDLYSLGVCFYYLITHLFPPRSDLRTLSAEDPYTPLAGRADLELLYGSAFLKAIDRALELKISDRWQSAAAWRIAIGEGMLPTPPKKARRIRAATIASAGMLAVFAGISFWALWERTQAMRAFDNSMRFTERLLYDFNQELTDIPGSTRLQRILGDQLNTYLNTMERPPGVKDERFLRTLAASWRNFGYVCMQQGKLEDADNAYANAVEFLKQLRQNYPEMFSYPYDLACVLLSRVEVARSRNQVEQARAYLREAQHIVEDLCTQAPYNPDFRCAMGQTLGELALLARAEGEADKYRKSLENMLQIYREVLAQFPDHTKAQEGLGYALQYNAQYAMDQENFKAAADLLDEARQVFSSLSSQHPYHLSFKKGLSLTFASLGHLYCRLSASADEKESKQYDEQALEAFRKHNDLVNYLETQDENKAEYPYMLCRALTTMVDILLRNGQPNLAEAYCNTISRKTEQLLKTAPDNVDYALLAAGAWRGVAMAHSGSAHFANEAAEEFAQYRAIVEKLLNQSPNITTLQFVYTDALLESANHALLYGQAVQARAWLNQAEEILLKLVLTDPDHAGYAARLERVKELLAQLPPAPQNASSAK